jgi:hypothetical protein
MTPEEIASEFAEIFDELPTERVNEMLAKNAPRPSSFPSTRRPLPTAPGSRAMRGDAANRLSLSDGVLEERFLTEPLA